MKRERILEIKEHLTVVRAYQRTNKASKNYDPEEHARVIRVAREAILNNADDLVSLALKALDEQEGWKPIESAPKDTFVLISAPKIMPVEAIFHSAKPCGWNGWHADFEPHWTRFNCTDTGLSPTHWMPLPSPPKDKDNE